MQATFRRLCVLSVFALGALPALVNAADWPTWGRDGSRNMISDETNMPTAFDPGRFKGNTEEIDIATTKNVKWAVKLGSQSYGNPSVAGGKVFVGTNNESPRDPANKGDRSVLMCFDEKDGKYLWQLAVPKMGAGRVNDWEFLGICSSPTVEGDRVYLVTNLCEALCLDVNGMANGNDGPFKEEGQYKAGVGKPAMTVGPQDADIIWKFDMREEVGVFPHNVTSCSILMIGDKLLVSTSNGVDNGHTTIPSPKAPALVMLDKKSGELLGEEASGISRRTLHSNWSTPSYGKVGAQELIFFGGGDGICYGFDTNPVKAPDGLNILKEVFRYDANPAHYRMKDGKPIKYATPGEGPSEIIATPVFYKNRIYVPIGQDPEHGEGVGNLACIDVTKTGDITKTGTVWTYDKIHRSISTVAIGNGLVFAPDFSGFVHCLDAETGKPYWVYDTKSHIWGSPLVADGKVYIGTEDGDFAILAADKTLKEINKVDMRAPVYSSPIVANGVMYVMTPTHMFAVQKTQ